MLRRLQVRRKSTKVMYSRGTKKRATEWLPFPIELFWERKLHCRHVLCLPALGSFDDVELHGLAFLKTAEAVCLDSREVNENVFAILAADETKALRVIEPLNDSLFHGVTCSFLN